MRLLPPSYALAWPWTHRQRSSPPPHFWWRILETRIGTASADAKAHGIARAAVVVIGSIAALRAELVASLIGAA